MRARYSASERAVANEDLLSVPIAAPVAQSGGAILIQAPCRVQVVKRLDDLRGSLDDVLQATRRDNDESVLRRRGARVSRKEVLV